MMQFEALVLHGTARVLRAVYFSSQSSVALEWKQTTRSITVEEGKTPEEGIYMQREVTYIHQRNSATTVSEFSCDAGQDEGCRIADPQCPWSSNETKKLEVSPASVVSRIKCSSRLSLHARFNSCVIRYVWEGDQVRVTADITSTDLLRIEVKAHQVMPVCTPARLEVPWNVCIFWSI
jgi:hypothetical protein